MFHPSSGVGSQGKGRDLGWRPVGLEVCQGWRGCLCQRFDHIHRTTHMDSNCYCEQHCNTISHCTENTAIWQVKV